MKASPCPRRRGALRRAARTDLRASRRAPIETASPGGALAASPVDDASSSFARTRNDRIVNQSEHEAQARELQSVNSARMLAGAWDSDSGGGRSAALRGNSIRHRATRLFGWKQRCWRQAEARQQRRFQRSVILENVRLPRVRLAHQDGNRSFLRVDDSVEPHAGAQALHALGAVVALFTAK